MVADYLINTMEAPLMKLVLLPKKNFDELTSTFVPSNLKNSPNCCPTNILGVPPLNCNCIPVFPNEPLFIDNDLLFEFKLIPLIRTSPLVGVINPSIIPIEVVLPHPEEE